MSGINQAIFKLPGEEQLHFISQSVGVDKFVVHPFNKFGIAKTIIGNITNLTLQDAVSIVKNWPLPVWEEELNKVDYTSIVEESIRRINLGEFSKVVPARTKVLKSTTSLIDLFEKLISQYPNAFVYVFFIENEIMIGASPESLLIKDGNELKTEALGGTRTDGVYTSKETQEHSHIVDYLESIFNQLSYRYKRGQTESQEAGPVEHLRTRFVLESNGILKDINLLEALHPTPAVCGLPYKEAKGFLDQFEQINRGYYSGYIGPMFSNENFNLFVNLRCAEVFEGTYKLYAGAGVNALSDPKKEFQETENKMETIAQWLKKN